MNREKPVEKRGETRVFSPLHFRTSKVLNSVLLLVFWIAALLAFIKSFYVENIFGLVVGFLVAILNTATAFYRWQDITRAIMIYLVSIVSLIYDQKADNVVSFIFLAIALSFLVKDRELPKIIPYCALSFVLGYVVTQICVLFLNNKVMDSSMFYPELGCFTIAALNFRDKLLPRAKRKLKTLPVLKLSDFGLTAREVQILRLIWDGLRSKEIAAELSVSDGTIRTHIARINQKLKLGGTRELLLLPFTHTIHHSKDEPKRKRGEVEVNQERWNESIPRPQKKH